MANTKKLLQTSLSHLFDIILPPRCPVTGQLVAINGTVSPELWTQLNFIHKPFCTCCGNPFAHGDVQDDFLCAPCMADRPVYGRARAALKYDDASASMILKFKYADKTLLAHVFATWLAQSGGDILPGADCIIPVPLHRWRLLKRRYNQAALLADALSIKAKVPVLKTTLLRTRSTESQGKKSKAQRLENIRSAFHVRHLEKIKDKKIILIDDVMTSGATVSECAKLLLKSGAANVDVLTLSRVCYAE